MANEELKSLVTDLAAQLNESEKGPIRQIRLLVEHVGLDLVRAKVEETLQIEANGGMLTTDETRRRTPGGIFFYLIKEAMPLELRAKVFPGYGQRRPRTTTVTWEERMDIVEPLLNDEQGTISSLEMTIQGRPGRVEISGDSVVLIMNYTPDLSANQPQPRGVPQLPPETQRFVVYMGIMSWERVAKFLEQPEDVLIIKGRIVYDHQSESIALMAIGVTTKEIERRQKRDAKAQEQRDAAAKAKAQKQKEAARAPKPPKPLPSGAVIPTDAPPDVVETLQKLYQAADTLRQRIATKTQAGQKSSMEEKLLASNEKQIDGLLKQYG